MTNDALIEATARAIMDSGCGDEYSARDAARAALAVIAPAVLDEVISIAVWEYADTTAAKIRALKARYV